MSSPLVSVIIPTYNGEHYLGDAVQSILDQTYGEFEIIIVDDASPEDQSFIARRFTDPRIKYIRHERNKGAVAARKTGVHTSSGEILAFLDQDDLFHKQKLETHVDYLTKNPQIGLSYNGRFEILGAEKVICGIYNPPMDLHLADWILGFPVSPSDVVLRREWALCDEIWDDSFSRQAEHVIFNGQEMVFGGRLALAGCKFGNAGRALNFRRYHPHRVLKYLSERCHTELACQEIIFHDPRCPEDIKTLNNLAFSKTYIAWAYAAYIQEEYDLGQNFLRQVLQLNPSYFKDGDKCQFLDSWLVWISAGTVDHVRGLEEIIRTVFENLPCELNYLQNKLDWAIARGHLLKGLHTMLWGKEKDAESHIWAALEKGATFDAYAMSMLSDELLSYENELDNEKGRYVVEELTRMLSRLNQSDSVQFIESFYAMNRAFRNYHAAKYDDVPRDIWQAIRAHPGYVFNRGTLSVLFHSLLWWLNRPARHIQ